MLVGSILILFKKFTSRGAVHPIPIPTNLQSMNSQQNFLESSQPHYQSAEAIELQSIPSISGTINAVITNENIESIPNRDTEEPISSSMIMVAPINENNDIIPSVSQIVNTLPVNENVKPIEIFNETQTNENLESLEPQLIENNESKIGSKSNKFVTQAIFRKVPSMQYFNNIRYNKSMISLTGSIFLFVIIVAVLCISLHLRYSNDDISSKVVLNYILNFTVSILPTTLYFILNPNHLIIALQELSFLP